MILQVEKRFMGGNDQKEDNLKQNSTPCQGGMGWDKKNPLLPGSAGPWESGPGLDQNHFFFLK